MNLSPKPTITSSTVHATATSGSITATVYRQIATPPAQWKIRATKRCRIVNVVLAASDSVKGLNLQNQIAEIAGELKLDQVPSKHVSYFTVTVTGELPADTDEQLYDMLAKTCKIEMDPSGMYRIYRPNRLPLNVRRHRRHEVPVSFDTIASIAPRGQAEVDYNGASEEVVARTW
jgi:hypothetical protein